MSCSALVNKVDSRSFGSHGFADKLFPRFQHGARRFRYVYSDQCRVRREDEHYL